MENCKWCHGLSPVCPNCGGQVYVQKNTEHFGSDTTKQSILASSSEEDSSKKIKDGKPFLRRFPDNRGNDY